MGRRKKDRREPVTADEVTVVQGTVENVPEKTKEEKQLETLESLEALRDEHEGEEISGETEEVKPRKKRKARLTKEEKLEQAVQARLSEMQAPLADGVELGEMILDLTDGVIGARPKPWTETERKAWASQFGRMFAKYMPRLGDWHVDIAFAICTVALIAPRLVKEKKSPNVEIQKLEVALPRAEEPEVREQ
jgi:hypothetical protein